MGRRRGDQVVVSSTPAEWQTLLSQFDLKDRTRVEIEPACDAQIDFKICNTVVFQAVTKGYQFLMCCLCNVPQTRLPHCHYGVFIATNL